MSATGELSAESGVALRATVPDGPVHVHADPSLLHVVLGNLLTNAVEACSMELTGTGEVEVHLIDAGDRVERAYVLRVLDHRGGKRTAAAQALGMSYPTFLKRLRELDVPDE